MVDSKNTALYKFKNQTGTQMFSGATSAKQNDYPIHQLQETNDIKWIVIEGNIVHDATNSYFEQIRQPNGDIYLRLVDIFKGTKNRTAGSYQTNPVDDSEDSLPNYQNHVHIHTT